jgi:hypothetical protein
MEIESGLWETYLAQTHFRKMETTRNHPYQNVLVTKTNLDLWNTTLGYSFRFQHRNFRMLPIKSFVHDSGCTFICVEYCYPKGSPDVNS